MKVKFQFIQGSFSRCEEKLNKLAKEYSSVEVISLIDREDKIIILVKLIENAPVKVVGGNIRGGL